MATRKRKGQQSILPFTKCLRVQLEDPDEDVTATTEIDSESPPVTDDAIDHMETGLTSTSCFPESGPYDFAILLPMLLGDQLSDDQKYKALTNLDRPQSFSFPGNLEGNQQRQFQASRFQKFPWLTYSRSENGGLLFILCYF